MAKPGPCTDAHHASPHGWEAVGYDGRHDSIESFVSFREFQIGGVALMATTGPLQTTPGEPDKPGVGYRSRFSKGDEIAGPGYYSVFLKDHGVRAELTATPRVAFHRFTFPRGTNAHLIFDVGNPQGESGAILDAFVQWDGKGRLEGSVDTLPVYVKAYQPGASVKLYFVAELDKAPSGVGTFRGTRVFPGATAIQGIGCGFYLDLATDESESVTVKLGMSYTSLDNARLNLQVEADRLPFDTARQQA